MADSNSDLNNVEHGNMHRNATFGEFRNTATGFRTDRLCDGCGLSMVFRTGADSEWFSEPTQTPRRLWPKSGAASRGF